MKIEDMTDEQLLVLVNSDKLEQTIAAMEAMEYRQKFNKLAYYEPLEKNGISRQAQFHDMGCVQDERCFSAGNQLGKTYAGAAECAYHLTGRYPDWWMGRRFDRPVRCWVAGVTGESTRDNPQRLLLGTLSKGWGTGLIPRECLGKMTLARGVSDAMDTVLVKHVSGEWSEMKFKTYEKGREKWQGDTLDFIWFDEEPPDDIYEEGTARVRDTRGMTYLTFTPLNGVTGIVAKFFDEPGQPRLVIMRMDESPRYTAEDIEREKRKYPKHQWDCRLNGIPLQGEGAVFTTLLDEVMVDAFPIPDHFALIWGLDFGMAHPFAAALLAWNKDLDIIYVVHTVRMSDALRVAHVEAIKSTYHRKGNLIPCAWPQDGAQRREFEGALTPVRAIYKKLGLNMLGHHAAFEDGSNSTEAGIMEMDERFRTGRMKCFRQNVEWGQEYGRYHREKGLLVKKNDDLMSATRVGVMSRRYAKPFDFILPEGGSRGSKRIKGLTPYDPY